VLTVHDLSVIVVLHNSASSIERTVASIPSEAELVLIDNGSSDDGLARGLSLRPDALSLRAANRGFGAGCNRGVELGTRTVLMFLNPDAELAPGATERLVSCLTDNPRSIVGPNQLTEEGALIPNCRRRSTPWYEIAELLPSAERWLPDLLRRDYPQDEPIYRDGGPVAYLQGAAFLLMRDTLASAGGFDERYFLYSEEEDLADRVRSLGGSSILVSEAHVRHYGATSTSQVPLTALRHLYRSRVLFYAARNGLAYALFFSVAAGVAASSRLVAGALRPRRASASLAWWWAIVHGLGGGAWQARVSSGPTTARLS
jgi:N-acetylglucosaminyl-diphospho-decaprenol L-rhamnosyltransferase